MNRNVSIRRKQEGQAHAVQEPPAALDRRAGVIRGLEHNQGAAVPTLLQHPVPGLQTPVVMTDWRLIYNAFDAAQERLRETLCTLGNGYFATRGAAEEAVADDVHYPGTYLAGGYNRLETEMAGQVIENEDFVNLPNWLCLTFRLEHGEWFDLKAVDVLSYCQELHLKHGVLSRTLRFRDLQGRETTLASRRLVHMGDRHLAATAITLTAENWSGRMQVRSALDGRIINAGVPRYQQLHSKHLMPLQTCQVSEDSILLLVQTNQSHLRVAEVARTQVFGDGAPLVVARRTIEEPGYIAQEFDLDLAQGATVTLEKSVALYTSRDHTMAECSLEARQAVRFAGRFDALLPPHIRAWERLWSQCDLVLEGSQRIQHMLRLHIFHLLQTVSRHTIDLDVGIPARGLHGEAYRGHVFWDELFVFPFLNLHLPEISRALLLYRYRRLPQARWSAREAGYCGAMYPWQSGSNGREENQVIHLNPQSGHWVPDNTHLQRHVNAAIAYNIWQYYQATADVDFLSLYGAEMLLEIARFLASTTTYNADLDCYEIHGVMGPDEYHDQYPDANEPGLNNNAYTNIMTVWTLQRAREVLQVLAPDHRQALRDDLDLGDAELERWEDISRKMRVVFHGDGIISQFEGYDTLEEFDW
ncbi:MAG: glycoside hydrolase family 65 protein, partial [Candidatus Tectomicrobia bacterium]